LSALLASRRFPAVCLGAAFLVRIGWILLVDPKPVSDCDWYFTKGIDISLGRGYQERGLPTAYWPVGYPAFLGAIFALFGRSVLVAKVANVLLYTGVLALSYWLSRRLFRSERTARLTLLLLSFYPNHIAYTSLVASEILFTFLMLLGVALLLVADRRFPLAVLAGVVFGLACLARPQLLPVPLVTILLLPRARRTALSLATVYAVLLLVLVPWTVRNYEAFGHLVPVSTNAGVNLLTGNSHWADGTYTFGPELERIRDGGNEYERDRRALRYAIDHIREHPVSTVKLWPRKLWWLYRNDVEGARWCFKGIEAAGKVVPRGLAFAMMAVSQAYYVLLVVACGATLLLSLGTARGGGGLPLLGLGIIGYLTLLGLVFFGDTRYHFPAMPWVAMYAAALPNACRRARRRVRIHRPRRCRTMARWRSSPERNR
jgi:4-amino-4-deoxy-L-arabinose transferase-like glycosyltransferase